MNRLLDIIVPQTWVGFLVRMAVLEVIVNITMFAVSYLIYVPGTFQPVSATIVATVVSVPILGAFMVVLRHIQHLKAELAQLAATDMLTGLPNRRAFMARIGSGRDKQVAGRAGTLLLLDVDHFKRVNDTYGHAIGDLCLQAMGRKLMDTVRNHDPVARIGGEEFAVFLTDTPRDQALLIGDRLTSALEVEARAQGVRLTITTSVGATDVPPGSAIDQMFRQADHALYHAKETGRARMVFFDATERRLTA